MRTCIQPLRVGALIGPILFLAIAPRAGAAPLATVTISIQFEGWPALTTEISEATGTAFSRTSVVFDAEGFFSFANFQPGDPLAQGFPYSHHHLGVVGPAGFFTGTTPGNVGGSMAISADYGVGTSFFFFSLGVTFTGTSAGILSPERVEARPWTAGPAVVTGVSYETPSGALTTDATRTRTGFNGLTAGGAGTLVLVSPMRITTFEHFGGFFGADITTAAFSTLTLTFVPEPRTALLLAAGLAALGGIRRRR